MLYQDFVWEITYDYTEQREIFRCDFGPRNGAENVILMDVLCYFFIKKSHNKLLEKLTGM
jgi:hypothetical protein